ncbi:MAG: tRNA (N6-threonylcarbamoyladenosine(37)-N6)-methyltransferase TrmO [Hyphomicrobiaceae bacterium]
MSEPMNIRPGDVLLPETARQPRADAQLTFVGVVRSTPETQQTAPKNTSEARSRRRPGTIEIAAAFRQGLVGLSAYSHIIVLGFLHEARRDLIQITRPGATAPTGLFALRSPVRPNPISLSVVRLSGVDVERGLVEVDAIDLLDGTPVIDIKPYRPSVDAVPDAIVP